MPSAQARSISAWKHFAAEAAENAEDAEAEKSDAETEEAWADAQGKGAPGQDRGAIELTPRRAATASLAQVKVCMEEV